MKLASLPVLAFVVSLVTAHFLNVVPARAMLLFRVVKCIAASLFLLSQHVNVTLSEIDGSTHVWIEKGGT
jgi:hypothetical protein